MKCKVKIVAEAVVACPVGFDTLVNRDLCVGVVAAIMAFRSVTQGLCGSVNGLQLFLQGQNHVVAGSSAGGFPSPDALSCSITLSIL